jgi:hypothetical protein
MIDNAKVVHGSPAVIQELTWSPSSSFGPSRAFEGVEQILFSFYNVELYKISVDYDRATGGLTAGDMVTASWRDKRTKWPFAHSRVPALQRDVAQQSFEKDQGRI